VVVGKRVTQLTDPLKAPCTVFANFWAPLWVQDEKDKEAGQAPAVNTINLFLFLSILIASNVVRLKHFFIIKNYLWSALGIELRVPKDSSLVHTAIFNFS